MSKYTNYNLSLHFDLSLLKSNNMKKIIAIIALVAFAGTKIYTASAAVNAIKYSITDDKDKEKKKGKKGSKECVKEGKGCCKTASAASGSVESTQTNGGQTAPAKSCSGNSHDTKAQEKK